MEKVIYQFWHDEQGQDFFEYTILLGVMVLGAVVYVTGEGSGVTPIWETTTGVVQAAAIAAS
jgi:Flp pilus assembly pilin Flp